MTTDLTQKTCTSCEGDMPPFSTTDAEEQLSKIHNDWKLTDNNAAITRTFTVSDFSDALTFINAIGDIAEAEGHHPDMKLHGYKNVTVTLSTHAIAGLSENDFILAAKIDQLHET